MLARISRDDRAMTTRSFPAVPSRLLRRWTDLGRSVSGSTSIEYALLASLIASATIGSASLLGGGISATLTAIADSGLSTGPSPAPGQRYSGPAAAPSPQQTVPRQ